MKTRSCLSTALLLALLAFSLPSAQPVYASTYVVNTTDDINDGVCNVTHCSLREAINAANAHAGADTITFNIPGSGVRTIQPSTSLPVLTDDAGVTIDGYTQPGSTYATAITPATLRIELDGTSIPRPGTVNDVGIGITSSNNTIKGLAINNFPSSGIAITELVPADVASFNLITGNHIGTNPAGSADEGNGLNGVYIGDGATSNIVGGDEPSERNVISGNGWCGVEFYGNFTELNRVIGNYIGINAHGDAALPNDLFGVRIYGGAHDNIIGVDNSGNGAGNVISGNVKSGVMILGGNTDDNLVSGNIIGLNATGNAAIPNVIYGVDISGGITGGPDNNLIGGSTAARRNVISGNLEGGIHIYEAGTYANYVRGNYIGTSLDGMTAIGNSGAGVWISQTTTYNVIGGCGEGDRNVISGNDGYGVHIAHGNADYNEVSCNLIGAAADVYTPLPNTRYGVYIGLAASHNTIGPKNLIAYNAWDGVYISGATADDNVITLNLITQNGGKGIELENDANNNVPAPVIYAATISDVGDDTVSGSACPNCRVEVFSNWLSDGEGANLLGATTAGPAGDWDLSVPMLLYPYLTATATRTGDGTSEFSAIFIAPFKFVFLPTILR